MTDVLTNKNQIFHYTQCVTLKRVTSWKGLLHVKSQSKENAEIILANCICVNWHSAKIIWI